MVNGSNPFWNVFLMSRLTQILKHKEINLNHKKSKLLNNPQKKAICLSVFTISPKKPNSANRRVAKVKIPSFDKIFSVKIPGEQSNNLQQHSTVLLRGSRVKDLIGVNLTAIRGKYDLLGVNARKTSRSLYGTSKS